MGKVLPHVEESVASPSHAIRVGTTAEWKDTDPGECSRDLHPSSRVYYTSQEGEYEIG